MIGAIGAFSGIWNGFWVATERDAADERKGLATMGLNGLQ
ncbi:hypothetical protein SynBOUM118_00447 [Synechococcus sp. BOUM118]|nr:hypothetical protein SynBOUM118_00447 [Synechococcus sp. BOUM118]